MAAWAKVSSRYAQVEINVQRSRRDVGADRGEKTRPCLHIAADHGQWQRRTRNIKRLSEAIRILTDGEQVGKTLVIHSPLNT